MYTYLHFCVVSDILMYTYLHFCVVSDILMSTYLHFCVVSGGGGGGGYHFDADFGKTWVMLGMTHFRLLELANKGMFS